MDDYIRRNAAIDEVEESRRLNHHQDGKEACAHEYEHRHFLKLLRDLPSADVIPVSWIEEQIRRLKEMDNGFASLAAGNISSLLKTWRDEVKDG
jgi:hypothetical protein